MSLMNCMTSREMNLYDLSKMEKSSTFPLPNLEGPQFKVKRSILNSKGEVVAVYWIKLTSEVSLVIDNEASPLTAALVARKLSEFLPNDVAALGLDDTHLFVKDDQFSRILVKHFNFDEVQDHVLFRRI